MARKSDESAGAEGGSFEKELARLEEIVSKLEAGALGLDESIALYEEGAKCLKACQARLARAEARIKQLSEGAGGPELAEFEAKESDGSDKSDSSDESDPAPKPRARKPRGRGLF
jgi:exodeoxyribonuclease VII small subunit